MEEIIEVQKIGNGEILFSNLEYDPERDNEFCEFHFSDFMDNLFGNFASLADILQGIDGDHGIDLVQVSGILEAVLRDTSNQANQVIQFLGKALGEIEFKFHVTKCVDIYPHRPVAVSIKPSKHFLKKMVGLNPV